MKLLAASRDPNLKLDKFIEGSKIGYSGKGYEIEGDDVNKRGVILHGIFKVIDNIPPDKSAGIYEGSLILEQSHKEYVVWYSDADKGHFTKAAMILAMTPQESRGLLAWVAQYIVARSSGNFKLAKQIKKNIDIKLKQLKINNEQVHRIYMTFGDPDNKEEKEAVSRRAENFIRSN